jgi:phage host-nuclease inhibitor protein Gam
MSPAPQKRIKAADMNSVTSLDELQRNIATIGELQNQVDIATAALNKRIVDLKIVLDQRVKGLNDQIKVLTKACQIYFSANQKEFVPAGKKSVIFDAGEIGTRTTPEAVTVKKVAEEDVIAELEKLELNECISTKKTINKNALKKFKEKVKHIVGIIFSQKEEFFIAPKHIEPKHLERADEQEA